MIRSMTGFGREQRIIDGREIVVEIRSVNHRYYEFSAKLHRQFGYLEEKLKTLLGGKINRGKVEVNVTVYNVAGKETLVTINSGVVEAYISALKPLSSQFGLNDDLSLSDVFRMTDAFNIMKAEIDEDAVWEAVHSTASAALEKFITMRECEGSRIKGDILDKLSFIENAVGEVEVVSPENVDKHRAKLFEKMKEIIGANVDEQRILLEAAVFAEKTAVDEETVRLRSHIEQVRELLEKEEVVGRKLDFIVQEMNREINTIGSKAQGITITKIVVDLKSELEKIREQIQNIE
ncbi:MAG: YicC family protein [Oscillospiraceae bacterium]|nr:YicC family protein [Oscillospiraceae bacterium]